MTNLWEEEGHQPEIFKDLYFMRWGVETNISIQKNIMQIESFSGLTVNAVLQDFYATVMIANLHAVLIKDAQKTIDKEDAKRKYPMKVNKNKSLGKLKNRIKEKEISSSLPTVQAHTDSITSRGREYFLMAPWILLILLKALWSLAFVLPHLIWKL